MLKKEVIDRMIRDKELKAAASMAFQEEFGFINDFDTLEYKYTFSERFTRRIKEIADMSNHTYVHLGGSTIRKSLAAAMIAIMILGAIGIVYAAGSAVVRWTSIRTDEQKNIWSIWFDIDDIEQKGYNGIIKPVTPGDLTIISENFDSESSTYEIIYNTADGEEVTFIEAFGVVDEGSYFGAKVTGQMEEDVTIGEYSGKHFYTLESSENILVWTDGYSLFMISGEYDYQSMIDMAEHYTETEYKRG